MSRIYEVRRDVMILCNTVEMLLVVQRQVNIEERLSKLKKLLVEFSWSLEFRTVVSCRALKSGTATVTGSRLHLVWAIQTKSRPNSAFRYRPMTMGPLRLYGK